MTWAIVLGVLIVFLNWGTNRRLEKLEKKVDKVIDSLAGLRQYLYEIDPQFDDERRVNVGDFFADQKWRELLKQKKESGRRTLDTPFARET